MTYRIKSTKKKSMKSVIAIIFILFIGACKSAEVPCYNESLATMENNPVETIDWLQDIRAHLSSSDAYIALYHWNNEAYFYVYVQPLFESDDFAPVTIYRSDGSVYAYCGGNSHPDKQNLCEGFNEKAIFVVKLWENNSCH